MLCIIFTLFWRCALKASRTQSLATEPFYYGTQAGKQWFNQFISHSYWITWVHLGQCFLNFNMQNLTSTHTVLNGQKRWTGNFHTESQILRYKRRHKEHSGGEASFVSILPAFWWRWYVCSYLKDRKKYKRWRREACTKTGGEQANLWDPT